MKYYSDEFKNNIVKLYHNENRSKKSLANEYGVHPTTISHWIKRAKLVELPDGGVTSVEAFKLFIGQPLLFFFLFIFFIHALASYLSLYY